MQYDFNVEQGCVFYKLFLRAFPNHFKHNSVYAHYPMTIPSENKKILASLGRESHYTWDRPAPIPPRVNLTSYIGAKYVLEHATQFKVAWGEGFEWLMGKGGLDFMLSGDSNFHTQQRQLMGKALYRDQWHQQVKGFYEFITLKLLREKSCKIAGVNQIDITREYVSISAQEHPPCMTQRKLISPIVLVTWRMSISPRMCSPSLSKPKTFLAVFIRNTSCTWY